MFSKRSVATGFAALVEICVQDNIHHQHTRHEQLGFQWIAWGSLSMQLREDEDDELIVLTSALKTSVDSNVHQRDTDTSNIFY